MKAPVQFIVLKRADKWFVKWQDAERIFPVQHKAVEAAIKLANDSGKNGKPAVVLFKRSKTDFRKIWTYGESAYPPTKSDLAVNARALSSTFFFGKLRNGQTSAIAYLGSSGRETRHGVHGRSQTHLRKRTQPFNQAVDEVAAAARLAVCRL
jgi:hypothetical protein